MGARQSLPSQSCHLFKHISLFFCLSRFPAEFFHPLNNFQNGFKTAPETETGNRHGYCFLSEIPGLRLDIFITWISSYCSHFSLTYRLSYFFISMKALVLWKKWRLSLKLDPRCDFHCTYHVSTADKKYFILISFNNMQKFLNSVWYTQVWDSATVI